MVPAMQVTLLFFAAARERAGTSKETLELPEGATASQAKARALELHPALAPLGPQLRVAVDQAFAEGDAPLREGSEVALIPPVSGGCS